ncbi:MAG: hypothetical protein EBV41_03445 [Actinobacteria bacterium]|nr:hypothetical protein [Actinomycetota bacterium]
MRFALSVLLGVVGSTFATRYALQVVRDAQRDTTDAVNSVKATALPSHTRLVGWLLAVVFGAVTGGLAAGRSWWQAAALVVTATLTIVQTPIDAMLHRLARRATIVALVAMVIVVVVHRMTNEESATALRVLSALGVPAAFAVLHFASPRSLGWGDVLLVAPLALAVSPSRIVAWLLLACCTAGAHGVILRVRRGQRFLPFGPHLLAAAWLAQAVSV